jgi:hypothetical protein
MNGQSVTAVWLVPCLYKIANSVVQPTQKPKPKSTRKLDHPKSLLTAEQIAHIKWLLEEGRHTARMVSNKFGLTIEYVYGLHNIARIVPKRHPNPEQIFPSKEIAP